MAKDTVLHLTVKESTSGTMVYDDVTAHAGWGWGVPDALVDYAQGYRSLHEDVQHTNRRYVLQCTRRQSSTHLWLMDESRHGLLLNCTVERMKNGTVNYWFEDGIEDFDDTLIELYIKMLRYAQEEGRLLDKNKTIPDHFSVRRIITDDGTETFYIVPYVGGFRPDSYEVPLDDPKAQLPWVQEYFGQKT